MKPIYMDHHATTPLDPRVLDAMMPYLTENFGNAASNTHVYGHDARRAVENARKQVADLIHARSADEIIFTSGATESDNLALKGVADRAKDKGRIITIATEHKAILDTAKKLAKQGFEIVYAKLDQYGIVDLDDLKKQITKNTILISIQAANSEIGTLQPLEKIGALARENGVPFHSDAVQALGKADIDVERCSIDLLSVSGHKMYGPKGVGALYVRKGHRLEPQIDGGGHEKGMRSGTLNIPGIVGLGEAARYAKSELPQESKRLLALRNRLASGIVS
ncbi:cysteine desulfurase, partial [candidate division KSB1 bacterium]|nr:cysteine desulfurase [candidate division KSB1 bacterium]